MDGDCPAEWKLETRLESQALEEESYQQLQNLPLYAISAQMLSADKILKTCIISSPFSGFQTVTENKKKPEVIIASIETFQSQV